MHAINPRTTRATPSPLLSTHRTVGDLACERTAAELLRAPAVLDVAVGYHLRGGGPVVLEAMAITWHRTIVHRPVERPLDPPRVVRIADGVTVAAPPAWMRDLLVAPTGEDWVILKVGADVDGHLWLLDRTAHRGFVRTTARLASWRSDPVATITL